MGEITYRTLPRSADDVYDAIKELTGAVREQTEYLKQQSLDADEAATEEHIEEIEILQEIADQVTRIADNTSPAQVININSWPEAVAAMQDSITTIFSPVIRKD